MLIMLSAAVLLLGVSRRSGDSTDGPRTAPVVYHVDLNTADAAELQLLPGIGRKTADGIVAHREQHGPFTSPEGLTAVSQIGDKRVERLRPHIVLK